jgi:hypothetical protein
MDGKVLLENKDEVVHAVPQKSSFPPKNIPQSQNNIPPTSTSLVDRSRFWQNGLASQHVRKEPTKNEFLVNFCFELTV